jgi:hypothetical protein
MRCIQAPCIEYHNHPCSKPNPAHSVDRAEWWETRRQGLTHVVNLAISNIFHIQVGVRKGLRNVSLPTIRHDGSVRSSEGKRSSTSPIWWIEALDGFNVEYWIERVQLTTWVRSCLRVSHYSVLSTKCVGFGFERGWLCCSMHGAGMQCMQALYFSGMTIRVGISTDRLASFGVWTSDVMGIQNTGIAPSHHFLLVPGTGTM